MKQILYWKKSVFKYFFGYMYHSNDSIKDLLTKLPNLNGSIKAFEKVKNIFPENHENKWN